MLGQPQLGSWWMRSKSDPRWDCDDRSSVGGFQMPTDLTNKINELKATLGEPPKDLEWGYMKD